MPASRDRIQPFVTEVLVLQMRQYCNKSTLDDQFAGTQNQALIPELVQVAYFEERYRLFDESVSLNFACH